jgi:hypothetical protein
VSKASDSWRGPRRSPRRLSLTALGERWRSSRAVRVATVVAVLALSGLVSWLAIAPGGGSKPSVRPLNVSAAGLKTLENLLRQPIYWLGDRAGTKYEFTQTPDRRVYVRYLPTGVKVGAKSPYLTVGTYPVADAFALTRKASLVQGNLRIRMGGGAVAFAADQAAKSAYVAFPGVPYQIEVYDPEPGEAIRLVTSGALTRVDGESTAEVPIKPVVLGESALESRLSSLGRPAYWLGPRAGVSYELSRTVDGRIYVRYLPRGRAAGSTGAFLTVGTYPGPGSFVRTEALAGHNPIRLAKGGIAAVSKASPKSVYAAFPGVAAQVEVYSPVPGEARRLVSAGRLVALG